MQDDIFEELHLRRVINASGTLTTYGQSAALPAVVKAMAEALPQFFEMDVLHARASAAIAQVTGAEAGFVTACAAAGLTLGVAACMTGTEPAKIAQLPDATGMKDEVIIQMGHCVDYGAPVTQGIRLAGAQVKIIGTINSTSRNLFAASITPRTAAAMYVISHHTVQYGYIPLRQFVETAHQQGVPVIVDAAAEEYMLPEVIAAGADLVVCSGHKHFRGPTSGIMAGRLDLIRAAYAQNRGIGRGMKIGKEGIIGLITALQLWGQADRAELQLAERAQVQRIVERLKNLPGIHVSEIWPSPDPYPTTRAKVTVDPGTAGLNAMALSVMLAQGNPSIKTRAHHVEEGYFLLDPFNLSDADIDYICERIEMLVKRPLAEKQEFVQALAGLSAADLGRRGAGEWPLLA
ncbi:aminotransferase class V-fold PLP-dependent enzyme [soil metagenome]